jgi:flavin-binding protein dodecin
MASHVAKVTELTAKSDKSFEDAIQTAIKRASKTIRNITAAWVKEQRVEITGGTISAYQVNLLVTFVLDE